MAAYLAHVADRVTKPRRSRPAWSVAGTRASAAHWQGAERQGARARRRPEPHARQASTNQSRDLNNLVLARRAFRRSELVSLDVPDLEFTQAGLVVTVGKSKTDQEKSSATYAPTRSPRWRTSQKRASIASAATLHPASPCCDTPVGDDA